MAEIQVDIPRVVNSLPQAGGLFSYTYTFSPGDDDLILFMPIQRLQDVSVQATGLPTISATIVPKETIVSSGTTMWDVWDGKAAISTGLTALKVSPGGSAGVAVVTVRAEKG